MVLPRIHKSSSIQQNDTYPEKHATTRVIVHTLRDTHHTATIGNILNINQYQENLNIKH